MSPDLLNFAAGFMCCGLLIVLYLLSRAIDILREFISMLKEELKDD